LDAARQLPPQHPLHFAWNPGKPLIRRMMMLHHTSALILPLLLALTRHLSMLLALGLP